MPGSRQTFQTEKGHHNGQQVLEVLDQYLHDREKGLNPNLDSIIARFPHLENELRECLPGLEAIELFADTVGQDDEEQSHIRYPQFSDYRVLGELGRGGMGIVYRAEQISLPRPVALKVLPLAAVFDQKNLQRFKNEANATARLNHDHIINVYSFGCENGIHFYAMQLVDGQSLADVIRILKFGQPVEADLAESAEQLVICNLTKKTAAAEVTTVDGKDRMAETRKIGKETESDRASSGISLCDGCSSTRYIRSVAEMGVHIADALYHAHEMGIVHRDIKPSNLLLDSRGKVCVSDFGLAQVQTGVNLTLTGDVVGTLRYMSPEQAHGAELVDHRADIYSLGATLYELLTLQPAVRGKERKEILKNLLNENLVPPCRLNPRIPVDLETVILKSLEPSRENRYANAREFADDLSRVLGDQPIHARRATIQQRVAKWMRRNRWFASTAAIFATLLLIGSLASALWIYGKNEELKYAQGELLQQNTKLQAALERAESAETKVESNLDLLEGLGAKYFDNRKYSDAIKMFDAALVLDGTAHESRLQRALGFAKLEKTDEAESAFNEIVKTTEGQQRAAALTYRALYFIQQDRANESINDLKLSLAQSVTTERPKDEAAQENRLKPEAMVLMFLAHWHSDEFAEAERMREQVLQQPEIFLRGHRYCIEAIYQSRFGTKVAAKEEFYKAIRWYGYRIHFQPRLVNEVIKQLLKSTNEILEMEIPVGTSELWKELKFRRIESSLLSELATVTDADQQAKLDLGLNNDRPGVKWTALHPNRPDMNGGQLLWEVPTNETSIGSRLTIHVNDAERAKYRFFRVFEPGEYQMTTSLTSSDCYGIIQFWLNGRRIGEPVDLFENAPVECKPHLNQKGETDLGIVQIIEGINELQIEIVGKNDDSKGYNVGVDFIDLWPVGYSPGLPEESEN